MSTLIPPQDAINITSFYTWFGSDGICRTVTKTLAEVDLAAAKENSVAVNSFYTNKKFPLLIDSRNIRSISKDARKHFSTNGRTTKINCFALIIDSPVSSIIGNFFMGLNKPEIPAKLFTSETEAIQWLRQYL